MKWIAFAAGLLLSGAVLAQSPTEAIEEAVAAGVLTEQAAHTANDYYSFYVQNAVRIVADSKSDGPQVRPASELLHKATGAAVTEAELADFNPLMYDLQADPQLTVFYTVGEQTIMVISEQRLQVMWKRHQINTQAQQNRNR